MSHKTSITKRGSFDTNSAVGGSARCRLADPSVTTATTAFAVDDVSVTTATAAFVDDDMSSDCVDHVPPAWGSPARDAPCLGMPPLPQAGDGPPSSEGCGGPVILTFTLTTNSAFGIYNRRRLSRTLFRSTSLTFQSLGLPTPRGFAGCRELLRSTEE